MYKPELAYRSEAQPSEERVMKGYTCGQLERERHRVHFSVLLVADPQKRSKAYVSGILVHQRGEKYHRKIYFCCQYCSYMGSNCGRVVVEHRKIMMSWFGAWVILEKKSVNHQKVYEHDTFTVFAETD